MTEVIPKGGATDQLNYHHLAERLGLDAGGIPPRFMSPRYRAKAHKLMSDHGLEAGRFAVFAPLPPDPEPHWFGCHLGPRPAQVRDGTGPRPVIPRRASRHRCRRPRIARATPGVVQLASATRLPEAAALIRHAGLLVGVDTGPHPWAPPSTPPVAIFSSTRPILTPAGRTAG